MDGWDILIAIIIIGFVSLLFIAGYYQGQEEKECKENGGIVLEHFNGSQCLTKEDIKKLRGDE